MCWCYRMLRLGGRGRYYLMRRLVEGGGGWCGAAACGASGGGCKVLPHATPGEEKGVVVVMLPHAAPLGNPAPPRGEPSVWPTARQLATIWSPSTGFPDGLLVAPVSCSGGEERTTPQVS